MYIHYAVSKRLPTPRNPVPLSTCDKWKVTNDQLVYTCWKLLKALVNLSNLFICLELSMALFRTEDCFTKLNQSLKWPAKWKMASLHFTDSWLRHRQTMEKKKILLIFTPSLITLANDFSEGDCYMLLQPFKPTFPLASVVSAQHFWKIFLKKFQAVTLKNEKCIY